MINNYKPIIRDWFVDIGDEYKDIKLYHVEEKENQIYAAYFEPAIKGRGPSFVKKSFEELKGPFFPSYLHKRKTTNDLQDEYNLYIRIGLKIESYILNKEGYQALINEIENYLINSQNEEKDACKAIIKILIGETLLYKYKVLKSGEYLCFSDTKINYEKNKSYYSSLADEIKIKSDRISLLVSHSQTVGNYREYILRQLLKKYIPSKFSVATGFIEGLSRQIDIIIYDSFNYSPSFQEGDLVVVRKESVRAIIEVKTNLTSSTLEDSLNFFYEISRPGIYFPLVPLFKGVFAFESDYKDTTTIAEYIKGFYTKPYFEEQLQKNMTKDILYLFHNITCVTVLGKHCVFSHYDYANNNTTDNMIPKLFSISDRRNIDIQTAMFIALLYDYFDVEYYGKLSIANSFSKIQNTLTVNLKMENKLTDDNWLPRTAHQNEHKHDRESVIKRLDRINEWFNGSVTTTELVSDYRKNPSLG